MRSIRQTIVAISITGVSCYAASEGMQFIGLHKVEPLAALALVYPAAYFHGFLSALLLDYVR